MKLRLLAFALLVAGSLVACGGDKSKPAATPRTDAPAVATPPVAAGSGAADVVDIAAPALPARTCPPAHAATFGACKDGLRCLLILEISDACVVKVANELEIPDLATESDGAGIEDLIWPTKDGALYVVNRTETWSWAAVPSPLTAPRDALAKATWTTAKVGDLEPEGYQYGLATDGAKAILVGCKKWGDECGADAEECEEWFCTKHVFVDPHTRKKLAKAPALPFVAGPKTGKITEAVTLGKKGKEQTCASGTDAPETWYDAPLDGSVALSATDWLALRYQAGSRMRAKWGVDVTYRRGCSDGFGVVEGTINLGPNQLWSRSVDTGWELQHGALGTPLTDATGKIKTFGDTLFVFAAD
ncbi:MAG TPA: hypothetical protein VM261_13835 [Kofleriaceae bacterium]|nr:hypothetical protein [Kofleriaceae bacterium]